MLQPKKQKHRKMQKGRSRRRTTETRGLTISYGEYGLQATSSSWVNSRQIESVRKTLAHAMKREGRVWIRIFPDKPVTKLPPEVTLGGGKGNIDSYVFPVKPGRILFEVAGANDEFVKIGFERASAKLPFATKMIRKEGI